MRVSEALLDAGEGGVDGEEESDDGEWCLVAAATMGYHCCLYGNGTNGGLIGLEEGQDRNWGQGGKTRVVGGYNRMNN